jgi:hypothetical protein
LFTPPHTKGAKFNYEDATPDVLAKVAKIEAVCAKFDIPIAAAALQFPLGSKVVSTVIVGKNALASAACFLFEALMEHRLSQYACASVTPLGSVTHLVAANIIRFADMCPSFTLPPPTLDTT